MAVYYSMISWVDEQIGRLLSALDELELTDETLIVFTTDHGEFCFEHGMVKKDLVLLESLLHIPLLFSYPGAFEPRVIADTFVEQVDLMPTILDLVGAEIPFGVQGRSIAPLIRGESNRHKDAVYAEICPPWLFNPFSTFEEFEEDWNARHETHFPFNIPGEFNKAIRTRDYRYVWYASGEEELYHLPKDPWEQFNVSDHPAYRDVKDQLKLQLLEWNALTEDPLSPLTTRILHSEYPDWKNTQHIPGRTTGAEDLELRLREPPWR
jgi:arylsulfatase A-like enzyme